MLLGTYAFAFAAVLSPAWLQIPGCPSGNPALAALEFEVEGVEQLNWVFGVEYYEVAMSSPTAVLRVRSQDPGAEIYYQWWVDGTYIDRWLLGRGDVEAEIDIPEGERLLRVEVIAPGGKRGYSSIATTNSLSARYACTEAGIRQAIADGGGPHYFDCEGPTTIVTSAEIVSDGYYPPGAGLILDGEGNITLDGNGSHRLLSSVGGGSGGVEFRGFAFVGGATSAEGGGIYHYGGLLTLTRCTVSENSAELGGGGIFIDQGGLILNESMVTGNIATGATAGGGGIDMNGGLLEMTGSTVSYNSAYQGGGINCRDGDVTVASSSLLGNVATGLHGGGFANFADRSNEITFTNSTISGNAAAGTGGGIYNIDFFGPADVALIHTTVSGNTATSGGHALVHRGACFGQEGELQLIGSIIDGECQMICTTPDARYTIESPGTSCNLPPGQGNEMGVGELGLGQLQDNGGDTFTHAPQDGSVAIDFVPAAACVDRSGAPLTTDQRGEPRPQNNYCDGGSVEGYCESCDDDNDCTIEACDPATRACVGSVPVPDGTPCDSGTGECVAGVCDRCVGVTCPSDDNECTDDACDPTTGTCVYDPVPDGTSCESGHAECSAGACRGPEFIGSTWYRGLGWGHAVVMDPSGHGIAVWSQCDDWCGFGGTDRILGRYYSPIDGWGSLFRIDNVDDSNALYPDVAMDKNGNAVAVWAQWFPGLGHVINASYYTAGVGWDPPVPISEAFSGSDTWSWKLLNPTVRMDSVGRAVAVWKEEAREDYGSGAYVIDTIVANTMSNGTWGTPVAVDNPTTERPQASFELAMAWYGSQRGADAMLVWQEYDQYQSLVVWARRFYGYSGWQDPVLLGDGYPPFPRPQVAMDSDGNAIAVWRETETEIWTRRFSGSAWGDPEVLVSADLPYWSALYLDVAVPPFRVPFAQAEEAVVVWNENDNPGANEWTNLWTKRYTPSGGWGSAELLETHDGKVEYPHVALDVEGNAVAVWVRKPDDSEPEELWINRYRQTPYPNLGLDGWTTAEQIESIPDNNPDYIYEPEIAMVPYREGVVVWSDGPYAQNVRWTSAPAPTLSNGRSTHVPSSAFCTPNNYFRLQADYWDPDGDIASSTVRVFVELFWSNSTPGFQQAYESESTYNQVSGSGFSGTVTANNCIHFGSAEWVDVTLTIWDAAQNESLNSVTMRVDKPIGAN